MRESEKISVLKGVGEKTEQLFFKAGVHTIGDLLAYYPRTYDIYEDPVSIGEIQEGKIATVTGAIFGRIQVSPNPKLQITTLYVGHDRDIEGDLVSDAVSAQYAWQRWCDHAAGADCAQKGRTCDGASGDFLSQCIL